MFVSPLSPSVNPLTNLPAILEAFKILGYNPFHASMSEQPENNHLLHLYLEAMQARFEGTVTRYGRKEFDKLFKGKWDVSCNMPGSLFADDLIKAYPTAKVVLTTRDVDKWMASMRESVDAAAKWRTFDWLASWDPVFTAPWWRYHKYQHSIRPILAPRGEKRAYLDHYERINEMLPPERVLNFHVSEGWEPLCRFLGKDIPDVPFPNVNNKDAFLNGRRRRWFQMIRIMLRVVLRRFLLPAATLAVVLYLAWTTGLWSGMFGLIQG
jgi:hypothetical protein